MRYCKAQNRWTGRSLEVRSQYYFWGQRVQGFWCLTRRWESGLFRCHRIGRLTSWWCFYLNRFDRLYQLIYQLGLWMRCRWWLWFDPLSSTFDRKWTRRSWILFSLWWCWLSLDSLSRGFCRWPPRDLEFALRQPYFIWSISKEYPRIPMEYKFE